MQRDMDLIRTILLKIEAAPAGEHLLLSEITIEGHSHATLFEHVDMLKKHGLIEATVRESMEGPAGGHATIQRLTWPGHDFLASIRSQVVWRKVRDQLAKVGGSATIEIVKAVAIRIVRDELGV